MKDKEVIEILLNTGKINKINRRDFIHYSFAAGLTVAAASSLWTSGVQAQTP